MRIRYIAQNAIDLGGEHGHVWTGRTLEVPDAVAWRLIHRGDAVQCEDPVEPVRVAEPPKRRTR